MKNHLYFCAVDGMAVDGLLINLTSYNHVMYWLLFVNLSSCRFKLDTQARFIDRTQNLEVRETRVKGNLSFREAGQSKLLL